MDNYFPELVLKTLHAVVTVTHLLSNRSCIQAATVHENLIKIYGAIEFMLLTPVV